MSKISVIVPVYNGEEKLDRCIGSLLNQDFKDFEAIIVDDGSKDDSYAIMCRYAEKDSRIRPVHKENGGVSSTRNLALSLAQGDYIQFMDVDDWLPFDSLKLFARAMSENDCEMVIADFYRVIDDKVSQKGSIRDEGLISRNEYADKMMMSPADFYYGSLWNKFYRRDIIEKYGLKLDESVSYCEDVLFNLQYISRTEKIYVLKAPVYYYVKTEGSLVAQNMNVESAVRMKTNVIRYYDDFYKTIFDEKQYLMRKPFIWAYLTAISTDGLALPVFDDTRKLGDESVARVFYDESFADTDFMFGTLAYKLLEKLLLPLSEKYKLELNDVWILYCLDKKDGKMSVNELSGLLHISMSSCLVSLGKLSALSYCRMTDIDIFDKKPFYVVLNDHPIREDLRKIEQDYRRICYDGLDEQQISRYEKQRQQILHNILKIVA